MRSLLVKFLLILVPVFLVLAVPGIGYLVHLQLRTDQEALARRVGNQAARAAMALARHDLNANPALPADLLAPLAADRAIVCAELTTARGVRVATLPPAQGCLDWPDIDELVLPVGAASLLVRFTDVELREAERRELALAVSVVTAAFLSALLAAAIGFRLIVGHPLHLLLSTIRHSAATGEKRAVGLQRADELGAVIRAFDEMIERERERETYLTQANEELKASTEALRQLNEGLERRVEERTAELQHKTVLAEAASEAKSRFVWTMSHELRTPLNAIIGFAEAIGERIYGPIGNARYEEYIRDIVSSGRHLLSIINRVLDVAKIESGTEPLHEEIVDVARIIDECLQTVRPLCAAAGVDLRHRPLPAPVLVRVDRTKVKQVLLNLLGNSVKFTPAGGHVDLAAAITKGGALELVIEDSGIGMRPEDIPIALSTFGQVDNSIARRHTGTGLGLPLARMLVEMHDGELEVESALGRGCRVIVRLPKSRVLARTT
jgi:signal transduction histidine kinase